MSPLDFLRTVWPVVPDGWYCIATPVGKGFSHRVVKTIDEAAAYADKVRINNNVFFSTHVLKADRIWNTKTQDYSERTKENMRCSRVFFFDLDVNKNFYADQREAAADLKRFAQAVGLPRPMVVSSGGGLHVYWILEEPLSSRDAWLTQATRLKQLADHHGLKADPSRITDTTSLLRVAGTFNLKNGGSRPVQVLATTKPIPAAEWTRLLLAAIEDADLSPTPTKHAVPDADGLEGNLRREFTGKAPSMVALIKSCKQMGRIVAARGKSPEPEWYWGCIGVVKFTENGPANVHRLSAGDPRYTQTETQDKIDHWTTDPTTCSKLEEVSGIANQHLCKACPHYSQNQSPIKIARLMETAPPPVVITSVDTNVQLLTQIPDPPAPYKRKPGGSIVIQIKDEKTQREWENLVYEYDLYPIARSSNSRHETEQHVWRAHLPHMPEPVDFTIEASAFVDDKSLATKLGNHGIWPKKLTLLREFMSAYIRQLQDKQAPSVQHNQLGWTEDRTNFVLPTKTFMPNGVIGITSLSKAALGMKDIVCKKGTLEKQVELLHFYDNKAYVANQFYVLCSLGAAIFYATGKHGVIVHATGEPGASKSTALYAAAAMWGPPYRYTLNATDEGATQLYRNARREMLANLPLCLDEITDIAVDVAKTMAMNATQTGPRGRLEADGTPKASNPNERSSMILTTANSSLHSLLQINSTSGTASSVRVFEIEFRKLYVHKPWEADNFLRGLAENYGHVGEQFVRFSVDRQPEVVKRVVGIETKFGMKASMRQEERFWFAAVAGALAAGTIARSRGYIRWDLGYMEDWLLAEQLPQLRGTIADQVHNSSAVNILTAYLEIVNADMIKTINPHGGNLPSVVQPARGSMVAEYQMENKLIFVLKDHFRQWCMRQGKNALAVLRDLNLKGIVTNVRYQHVIGENTTHAKGKSTCFIVNMAHPEISAAVHLTVIQGGKSNVP